MRVEGAENVLINQKGSVDILSRLDTGDTLRAKVVDITANELLLKLFDGTLINAGAMTPVNAKRGDLIDFIVKNKVNNQLFLEILKDNGKEATDVDVENEIKNKLLQLGIKPDKRNMEAAAKIRANGAQINTETITKVVDAVVRFKNLTIDKAAYLISNNIAPEEKNIASLTRFVEGRVKLSAELFDLASSLGELQDKDVAIAILKKLNALDYASQKSIEDADNSTSDIDNDNAKAQHNQKDGYAGDDMALKSGTDIKNGKEYLGSKSKLSQGDDVLGSKFEERLENTNPGEKEILHFKKKTVDFINNYRENIDKPEKKLMDLLKSFQTSEDSKVSEQKHSGMRDEAESIKKSFEKMFVKINEEIDSRDINVKEVYKDIYKKLEMVRGILENSNVPGKEDILNRVDSLKSNISFLNELNNHSVYFQIPLKVFDRNTTGELYILKRNNGRNRIDPQNATVFISLDTENLGQVDSLISVSKKNVSLNLRLEKDEIYDFIKENYIQLYEGLLKKGYKLVDIKYRLIDEKVNLLNAHEVLEKEIEKIRSKGFDCKI